MNASHQLNGRDYLIKYTIEGDGANRHEVIIRAIDARKAELIFANVYKGCRQTSSPQPLG